MNKTILTRRYNFLMIALLKKLNEKKLQYNDYLKKSQKITKQFEILIRQA